MQLKNRIFFSIAYYLCKSSHFNVFMQIICAIWLCFHRIRLKRVTILTPSALLFYANKMSGQHPFFYVGVLNEVFLTLAEPFFLMERRTSIESGGILSCAFFLTMTICAERKRLKCLCTVCFLRKVARDMYQPHCKRLITPFSQSGKAMTV